MNLTPHSKTFLLRLARQTIQDRLDRKEKRYPDESELPSEDLKEHRGTFVTLEKDKQLRGCIGCIMPIQLLYKGIVDNALNAAFGDPRFPELTSDELKNTSIEISILSKPKELRYTSPEDLLQKLKPKEHGVILQKQMFQSTFLPQVWESIPGKEHFLSQLCLKAGMSAEEWRKGDVKVQVYTVEHFSDEKPREQNFKGQNPNIKSMPNE